eukprot:1224672-Amphidinium_carterae.2
MNMRWVFILYLLVSFIEKARTHSCATCRSPTAASPAWRVQELRNSGTLPLRRIPWYVKDKVLKVGRYCFSCLLFEDASLLRVAQQRTFQPSCTTPQGEGKA